MLLFDDLVRASSLLSAAISRQNRTSAPRRDFGLRRNNGIVSDQPGALMSNQQPAYCCTVQERGSSGTEGLHPILNSTPIAVSQISTMIMLQTIANSHGVAPVRNGTAPTITKATLRAQVYRAVLRTSFAEGRRNR